MISLLSPPSPCGYLGDRVWQLRHEVNLDIRAREYMDRVREGWRRCGPVLFRPECPGCRMCQSLRIPVNAFRPNRSQRRAWRKNQDEISIRIGCPSTSPEKLDLFARFHQAGHVTKAWPADADMDLDLFVLNPFPTEEWCYFVDERLVGVGYVDALSEGLSAIYFFHDPREHRRSLGTFNILAMIESARQRQVPHVYLGFYIEGCRSMEYKSRFRPNEVLVDDGTWKEWRRTGFPLYQR